MRVYQIISLLNEELFEGITLFVLEPCRLRLFYERYHRPVVVWAKELQSETPKALYARKR